MAHQLHRHHHRLMLLLKKLKLLQKFQLEQDLRVLVHLLRLIQLLSESLLPLL
jgi:hypothetical protein